MVCHLFQQLMKYIIAGFLEKNRDTFSADLLQLIHNTSNKFLQHLFVEDIGKNTLYLCTTILVIVVQNSSECINVTQVIHYLVWVLFGWGTVGHGPPTFWNMGNKVSLDRQPLPEQAIALKELSPLPRYYYTETFSDCIIPISTIRTL